MLKSDRVGIHERVPHGVKRACHLAIACLAAWWCATASAAPAQQYRLAVVELRNEAELRPSEIAYLTDLARTQARQALQSERFLVMTRESMVALLPPGKTLADCAKVQCEVEVGRTIGADYIVTGEVLRFGKGLRLNLKVHACQSGDFLGSESAKGAEVDELEARLALASRSLFKLVEEHAGVAQVGSRPDLTPPGQYGAAAESWHPNARTKRLIKISSAPPGAMVLADGIVICQSTPCTRALPASVIKMRMQRERYATRTEVVDLATKNDSLDIHWVLEPTFGWLTVHTVPESLAVSLNGEGVQYSPFVRQEVEAGRYDIRVADQRFYEKGERVDVLTGKERVVTLIPTPREGAIEVSAVDAQGNDVDATVVADGKALGAVPGIYPLLVGAHHLEVSGAAGIWRGEVSIVEHQVANVEAKLIVDTERAEEGYELLAKGKIVRRGKLLWTTNDNGRDVSWSQAKAYCEACRVGGFLDWRMPTLEELETLYSESQNDDLRSYATWENNFANEPVFITKPFKITGLWQWGRTADSQVPGFVYFGGRGTNLINKREDGRVLCVRRMKPTE